LRDEGIEVKGMYFWFLFLPIVVYFIEIIYLIVMRALCLKEDLEDVLKNSSTYMDK